MPPPPYDHALELRLLLDVLLLFELRELPLELRLLFELCLDLGPVDTRMLPETYDSSSCGKNENERRPPAAAGTDCKAAIFSFTKRVISSILSVAAANFCSQLPSSFGFFLDLKDSKDCKRSS